MMKKLFSFVAALSILFSALASSTPTKEAVKKLNANEIRLPVDKTGKTISLMELSKISMEDMQKLTGKKMNWSQKFAFKKGQKKLVKSIEADGTITSKKLNKVMVPMGGETGFHFGGFILGFLLGTLGVLIAFIINDDYQRNREKWAWLGMATMIILVLIVALTAA